MLPAARLREIERELAKYPPEQRQSALPAALRIAQDEHGWLSAEVMEFVAGVIGVPPVRAHEVATFYSMFELAPVGRHKISVCTNISCMLRGSAGIVAHLEKKLKVKLGGTTADGKFTLREAECLAACAGAPMMQVDREYYENLTPGRVDEILEEVGS
ncbi:MAG: NADH-quinone oxidoreductase subunit NuoE [Gammaproteobacteria bacterium]|nr:NADH-quinone oxidoreductase subunit NuoE [Gammaproteobacteria bacterium]